MPHKKPSPHKQPLFTLNEELIREALSCQSHILYRLNVKAGHYDYISPAFETLTGHNVEEFYKNGLDDLARYIYPEDFQRCMSAIQELSQKKAGKSASLKIEYRFRRKDDKYLWFGDTTTVLFDKHGSIEAFVGVVQDITQQKLAEKKREESELRYRSLFDNMLTGFAYHRVVTDKAGKPVDYVYLEVNQAFENLTGLKRDDVIGKKVTELLPDISTSNFDWIGQFGKVALTGKPLRFEQYFEGMQKWFSISAYSPKPGHFGVIFSDITEARHNEAALRDSENSFRRVLESVDLVALMLDSRGNITFCNDFLLKITNRTRKEVINHDWCALFIPATEQEQIWNIIHTTFKTGAIPVHYVNDIVTLEGERRTIAWNNILMTDNQGKVTGITSIGEDITSQKQAEEASRLHEARLNSLYEISRLSSELPEAQFIDFALAEAVRLTQSNCGYLHFVVEDQLHLGGTTWSPEVQELCASAAKGHYSLDKAGIWADAARQQQPVIHNDFQELPRGKNYPPDHPSIRRHMCIPVIDNNKVVMIAGVGNKFAPYDENDVRQLHLVMHDLWKGIKRKRAEMEIKQLNTDLEERIQQRTADLELANRELESFCYSVSHDLRAPLRHINSYSAILKEDLAEILDEKGKQHLARLEKSAVQMGRLIDDLLELSRVSRGELVLESVDLSKIASRIVKMLTESEPERVVDWRISEGIIMQGDVGLLQLALQNLLENAWKYSSRKKKAVIEFGSMPMAGKTVCYVKDNGVGFDMAYANKLFSPFERLHAVGEFEGTGIGLATVQRIINRHGGRIWGEGHPNKGATFYFTLAPKTTE